MTRSDAYGEQVQLAFPSPPDPLSGRFAVTPPSGRHVQPMIDGDQLVPHREQIQPYAVGMGCGTVTVCQGSTVVVVFHGIVMLEPFVIDVLK